MRSLKRLFENNQVWIKTMLEKDQTFFKRTSKEQIPAYFWVGCSDSRVPANEIVGLDPGELFVHRNVANLFPHTDFNCLSVLEFAVDILKIEHIIVCGHYDCGGVNAAMTDHKLGLVDNWLRNIRDVYALHKQELDAIVDEKQRTNRLVELNVIAQAKNIAHTTIVQGAWSRNQPLKIHGWIYQLDTGCLKDLNCHINSVDDLDSVYKIQT